ncbi:hypothetical protein PsorP6_009056 [Peronosclerospora sorghi]|uniref:Uncharacterized protein n=1 Tax=Peronosclerospora sorghi TaxID=230839 RepID=A0ACC0VYJ8_9STRA|nr:hypothetical protein PsorP6_009056 [Peronosclerospora sorghi]
MQSTTSSLATSELPTTGISSSTGALVRELRVGEAPMKREFLKPKAAQSTDDKAQVAADATDVKNGCTTGHKKPKGTFKKRPIDIEQDPADMLCRLVASGESCPFGDKCKFSHDTMDYMKRKAKDLGEQCPVFNAVGYCRYGLACRFATAHIEKVDEKYCNIQRKEYVEMPSEEMNDLTHDVRLKLRKDTYNFHSKQQRKTTVKTNIDKYPLQNDQQREDKDDVASRDPPAQSPLLAERKPVDFKRKIYIAPLTTVGNLPFRRLMKQTGADITCGEMAMATNLLKAQQSEWALLRRHKSEDVFGVQLAGSFSDQMARVCELLARETDVDFVDINMGCPIDIVCRAGAGSALMNRPPRLLELVSGALTGLELGTRVRTGCSVNAPGLTVKLRTGWSEKQPNAHKLMAKLQSVRASKAYVNAAVVGPDFQIMGTQSLDAMTIHGRSRLQRYTKNADWDYIFQCSEARYASGEEATVPLIGGGDVLSYEEFHKHLENGKLETCMVARGALIKPWLPTEIKERRHWDISASERFELLKDFVRFGLEHWGSDQRGVNRTRRYLLEWQSFLCRYIPVGLLETLPQRINDRPAPYYGRNDLETLMASDQAVDWVKLSERLLGPVPETFQFVPKHRANAYKLSE